MEKSRVISKLRFKNWRSLWDVTIGDLTPITVFIGANSSGKTNIFDALDFMHTSVNKDPIRALASRDGHENILSFSADSNDPIEIEVGFSLSGSHRRLTYQLSLQRVNNATQFGEHLTGQKNKVWLRGRDAIGRVRYNDGDLKQATSSFEPLLLSAFGRREDLPVEVQETFRFISQRWQLLGASGTAVAKFENAFYEPADRFIIDRTGYNTGFILDTMQKQYPNIYDRFQADLATLLNHVKKLEVHHQDLRGKLGIEEKMYPTREAPTISGGTARIVAMLAAYYALDMRNPQLPGLIFIEEPDTVLHPLLLGKLVDLLREYTERDEPRQFILTTHNPQLLNYFEPEEVRVVERDAETGETWVDPVPPYIKETWLPHHRLGDAWTSRIIGGIPEE